MLEAAGWNETDAATCRSCAEAGVQVSFFLSYQVVKLTLGVWEVSSTMNFNTGIHSYSLYHDQIENSPTPSKLPCTSIHIHTLPPSLTLS